MKALRVLVVEDDPMIGVLLAETLVEMGHEVCGVEATEINAVAAAVRNKPDLMIVDAQLGAGSGICAVEEILRAGFVPHLFVSANALRVRALKPGAMVIQKPFRESDLIKGIERALAIPAIA